MKAYEDKFDYPPENVDTFRAGTKNPACLQFASQKRRFDWVSRKRHPFFVSTSNKILTNFFHSSGLTDSPQTTSSREGSTVKGLDTKIMT